MDNSTKGWEQNRQDFGSVAKTKYPLTSATYKSAKKEQMTREVPTQPKQHHKTQGPTAASPLTSSLYENPIQNNESSQFSEL